MAFQYKKVKATGVDDMVLISKLTHEEVTENLRKRHQSDTIYTYISDVLISVNPFKQIPGLCTPDQIETYKGKYRHELPPHIYALAETAYRRMANDRENQCVIITGESGAGKTEASKLIMQYIAAVSGKSEGVERVKKVILESNPLLEAFGNAKTIRNNNSSRFGKYFEIQFDTRGDPQGGRITNYLLEKSRVVFQAPGERSFHIFYQFCYGASKQERDQFGIVEPDGYTYLNQSGCLKIDNVDDAEEYKETRTAMDVIGITKAEQTSIMKIIAAILWLGNISFCEGSNGQTGVADKATLDFTASLLSVAPENLRNALLFRVISTGTKRGSTISVPQSVDQANAIRDALAKALYDRLFTWLVQRVNSAMVSKLKDPAVIGVLDIFGFEIFDNNGFEQFCINYVNEKLQQIFIDLTLAQEEAEYKNEGIKWEPIKYFNNKIVCDLIEETKPPGLFAVLDDTCHTTHNMEAQKADEKFLQKSDSSINNPHYVSRGTDFIIKHYAGQVIYNINGFTEKNKDNVFNTLIECMQSTKDKFIAQFFTEDLAAQAGKKPTTAGFKIKKSCQDLVETIRKCTPHYIRCIKPNETKLPRDFDQKRVLHQVQYLGLLENIRVRRAGFAFRCPFEKFIERFSILSKKTWPEPWKGDPKKGCEVLVNDCQVDPGQWQLGKTKIFLRSPETLFNMEEMKERKYHTSATIIARTWKNYKLKKYFLDLRSNAANLLENKKERRRLSVNRVFLGDYISYLDNAQLQQIMKPYRDEGGVVFADNFYYPIKKMLSGHRIEKLFVLLTQKALYYIERVKEKKQFIMKLQKRIPLNQISGVSMSTLQDNYLIVNVGNSEEMFAECNNKTEFLCILNDQYKRVCNNKDVPRTFSNQLQYNVNAKGKKKQVVFVKDATGKKVIAELSGSSSKWTVTIAEGLPADSKPKNILAKKPATTSRSPSPAHRGQSAPKAFGAPATRGPSPQKAVPGLNSGYESVSDVAPPIYVPETLNKPRSLSQIKAQEPVVQPAQQPQQFRLPTQVTPVTKTPATKAPTTQQTKTTPAATREAPTPAPRAKNLPPMPPPRDTRPKCKALYDYDGTGEDELAMKEGDIIIIVEKDASGWWTGILNGKTGLFPGNYTEELK